VITDASVEGIWDDMAVVGRVARPHGIRGQVIVNLETDFPELRFRAGAELFVKRDGTADRVIIDTVRFQQGRPVLGVRGIEDVDAARGLAGAELRIPRDQLAELPSGVFYRHDLVGCDVVTVRGSTVGTVAEVEGTLGGSRLVLDTPSGEVLVPLAVDICVEIAPASRRIVIDPPEGLLDLNAPSARGRPTSVLRPQSGR
jgi:16S rRNA processing protein RimM